MQGLNRHEALKHNADEGDDRNDEENEQRSYDFMFHFSNVVNICY